MSTVTSSCDMVALFDHFFSVKRIPARKDRQLVCYVNILHINSRQGIGAISVAKTCIVEISCHVGRASRSPALYWKPRRSDPACQYRACCKSLGKRLLQGIYAILRHLRE